MSTSELITCPKTDSLCPVSFIPEVSSIPWFAVYVKHRHEKSVALNLQSRGYESFLPTYLKISKDSKKSELPLFPGYVFCRFEIQRTLPIISTPGVFSIVGFGNGSASIPDREIEAIRQMLRSGSMPHPWAYVARGQQVYVKSGPLRGVEGVVVDDTHQKWLVVSIHLLQRSVAVKIDRAHI